MREIQRTRNAHGIGHQRRAAGLASLAVDAAFDEDIGGIELRFEVRTDRAEGVESFGARELDVGFLKVTSGDVVDAGVAENEARVDRLRSERCEHVLPITTPNSPSCSTRLEGGGRTMASSGPMMRRRRLEKDERFFRHFVAKLRGMRGIIAAHTHTIFEGSQGASMRTFFRSQMLWPSTQPLQGMPTISRTTSASRRP